MFAHISRQRFVRALGLACFVVGCWGWAGNASAQSPVRSIDVAYDGTTYVITAHMFAPVTQSIAWAVLTDFGNMAAWVPNVRQSTILKKADRELTIEQTGSAKFGLLSFSYDSVRDIVLTPQTEIVSTQTKGEMKRQRSVMQLVPEGDGTRLEYRLELEPSALAAAAISEDRLKHDIDQQFTAIVGEMIRRKKSSGQ